MSLLSILLNTYPEVDLPAHKVILPSHSRGTVTLFPQRLHHFARPAAAHRLPSAPRPCRQLFSGRNRQSNGCEAVSQRGSGACFPKGSDAGHLFKCLLAMCISSLETCVFQSFTHQHVLLLKPDRKKKRAARGENTWRRPQWPRAGW